MPYVIKVKIHETEVWKIEAVISSEFDANKYFGAIYSRLNFNQKIEITKMTWAQIIIFIKKMDQLIESSNLKRMSKFEMMENNDSNK